MLKAEARWLGRTLALLPLHAGSTLLNIGSSTEDYRRREQPWVHREIFEPLSERQVEVVHVDLKSAPGVDLVGDLLDPRFLDLCTDMQPDAVLCSNLLEHVPSRDALCQGLGRLVADQGHLIVTCPYDYPYHPDPIDTMFRPTVDVLTAHFPELSLRWGEIVTDERQWAYFAHYERWGGVAPYAEQQRCCDEPCATRRLVARCRLCRAAPPPPVWCSRAARAPR